MGNSDDPIHVELLRNLVVCFLSYWVCNEYCGVCLHASSSGVCFIGKPLLVVFVTISHSLSSKNMVHAMGDLKHA